MLSIKRGGHTHSLVLNYGSRASMVNIGTQHLKIPIGKHGVIHVRIPEDYGVLIHSKVPDTPERTTLGLSHVELGKMVIYTGFDPVVPVNRPLTHLLHTHHPVLNRVA